MPLRKPASVAKDAAQSAKWDELTRGRDFKDYDVPALTLLCMWYAVIDRCIEDLTFQDGLHVAYSNDMDDIKALPQIATMKQASAEIRQLNRQLGIYDGHNSETREAPDGHDTLKLILGRSAEEDRLAAAANQC